MPALKYTRELLEPIVERSRSFRNVVVNLGLKPHGETITLVTKRIKQFGLSTEHFSGKSWHRGSLAVNRKSASEMLKDGTELPAYQVKRALQEIGIKHKCGECGKKMWRGVVLPLQVHHIDGNNHNNTIDNLKLLCPNCHSITGNWGFRGRKHG